jgi:hypothetical protein
MTKRRPGNHQVFVRRLPVVAGAVRFSAYRAVRYIRTLPAAAGEGTPLTLGLGIRRAIH